MTLDFTYKRGHIPSLDGLRGLAALLVLIFHLFQYRFTMGWMGVDLFFVLSGFLITGILLDTKGSNNYYKNYLAKRSLRIFPLYYFILFIFFLVLPAVGYHYPHYTYLNEEGIQKWYWLYIQNWRIFVEEGVNPSHILVHFWSLAIEEQFYIFWPVIIYFVPKNKMAYVCGFLICLSLAVRFYLHYVVEMNFVKIYIFTFARLDALAVGALVACLVRSDEGIAWLKKYALWIFYAASALVAGIVLYHMSFDLKYFTTFGYTVLAIVFGCLLLISLTDHPYNVFKKFLETGVMRFFGKYSYGIYVYHMIVLRIAEQQLEPHIGRGKTLALVFVLSIVIAVISYHAIEKHFLKLKSRFH
jgi:peptidoglycan/LPS O-acetylase OafA/YrhL